MRTPGTEAEAVEIQQRLRHRVELSGTDVSAARTAVGLDVDYTGDRIVAAAVVLEVATLEVVQTSVAEGETIFPYIPGLFAFREVPTLLAALDGLDEAPDVLVCDGQGLAHPRRFGLACHLGVITGLPAIGVAKTPLGRYEMPGPERGARAPLLHDDGGEVGAALRTRDGVKPVFVSVGHRTDLDSACALTLLLTPKYRVPETTRLADQLCRQSP
ncbi:endonuclease V [Allokutzneria sp. NRRL B-24872]|uniref:endonuclease V n=1 Tax=Allokutzneria sp. NRRL B-24872 TaxID=1137961 RepID=UPI000A372257|nr:endonuclease V [Allokutzneria sp. NRRL B-24872]